MLADRVRATYLLAIATAEVQAAMYHRSCGVKIMATIRPVRTAPLGYSHAPCIFRSATTSIAPATRTAAAKPGTTNLSPSCGAASRSRITRMMVRSPLGVWKNRQIAELAVLTEPPSLMAPQVRTDDQPVHAHAIE